MLKKIAIYGAGGFGREVAMLIEQINQVKKEWDIIGFFDDGKEKGTLINNLPIIGGINELNEYVEELYVVIAIVEADIKKKILKNNNNSNIKHPILIHPSVLIGKNEYVKIGEGTIICAGVIITVNIEIGKHVILNLSCTVGHDTIIHDFCSFMPTVNISGEVVVYSSVFVGTGSKIINRIEIGENVIVGAGAVIAKNLPANCTAVGIPAKPIKFNNTNEK